MATRLSLEEWRAVYIATVAISALTRPLVDEKAYKLKADDLQYFAIFC